MSGIRVNHGSLEAASQDLVSTARDIEGRLDQLESELSPLRSEWEGQAQQAYLTAKAQWDTAIAEMIALLESTGNAVQASNQEYRAADLRGADRFPV
ncbi:WXG100 family type VII secretion target [Nocardioides zeae]|jgi:WXG100 family type VII secretion target|uniref:ESAT-6-like protein n=1 Tax=Nocardioides zeae TaxID=1457234 RepID=A0A6P0HM92_9ACTN|nr:WXG100 family type VII secretion target [Nocardioides zeae]NEN79798.1 WXG100 family type VII secretion target [Nocardioides zeae]